MLITRFLAVIIAIDFIFLFSILHVFICTCLLRKLLSSSIWHASFNRLYREIQQSHSFPLVLNLPLIYLQHFSKTVFYYIYLTLVYMFLLNLFWYLCCSAKYRYSGIHAVDLWKSLLSYPERTLIAFSLVFEDRLDIILSLVWDSFQCFIFCEIEYYFIASQLTNCYMMLDLGVRNLRANYGSSIISMNHWSLYLGEVISLLCCCLFVIKFLLDWYLGPSQVLFDYSSQWLF